MAQINNSTHGIPEGEEEAAALIGRCNVDTHGGQNEKMFHDLSVIN
jgi:hypothetical protein